MLQVTDTCRTAGFIKQFAEYDARERYRRICSVNSEISWNFIISRIYKIDRYICERYTVNVQFGNAAGAVEDRERTFTFLAEKSTYVYCNLCMHDFILSCKYLNYCSEFHSDAEISQFRRSLCLTLMKWIDQLQRVMIYVSGI